MTSRTTDRRIDVGSRNVSSLAKKLTTTARRGMIESRVYSRVEISHETKENTGIRQELYGMYRQFLS